jgi:hypothetical protein
MNRFFAFGERLEGYAVPVLNERAVRAAAGILLMFAMAAFMNAWLLGNFQPTRVFVVAFLIDFTLRIFVNPRYSPTLVLGQWLVCKQQPEWVGAPQKRFAWAIGFVLASVMFYLVVLNQVIGPINIVVCAACITLLFFESAFGICIGCKLYNWFSKDQAQLCPGGVCELTPDPAVQIRLSQGVVLALFFVAVAGVAQVVYQSPASMQVSNIPPTAPVASTASAAPAAAAAEAERCKVPDFAKAIGHEDMWKLHNKC